MKVLKADIGKEVEVGNKDYVVVDPLREIRSSLFPFVQHRVAFAALFQFAAQDWSRRFNVNFLVERIGGGKVSDITFDIIPAEMFGGFKPKMPFGINAENIEFPEPGDYRFVITLNGKLAHQVPFKVEEPENEEFPTQSELKVVTAYTCRKAKIDSINTRLHSEGIHFQIGAAKFPFTIAALDVAGFFEIPPFWQGRRIHLLVVLRESLRMPCCLRQG